MPVREASPAGVSQTLGSHRTSPVDGWVEQTPFGACRSGPRGRKLYSMPERHLRAAKTHDDMAARHDEAALHWDAYGEPERSELERRNAEIERAAAQLERDRADFKQRKVTSSL